MEEQDKAKILRNLVTIKETIASDLDGIMDLLIENGVFTIATTDRIKQHRSRTERTGTFITTLIKSGSRAYECFAQCLRDKGFSDLVEKMEGTAKRDAVTKADGKSMPDMNPNVDALLKGMAQIAKKIDETEEKRKHDEKRRDRETEEFKEMMRKQGDRMAKKIDEMEEKRKREEEKRDKIEESRKHDEKRRDRETEEFKEMMRKQGDRMAKKIDEMEEKRKREEEKRDKIEENRKRDEKRRDRETEELMRKQHEKDTKIKQKMGDEIARLKQDTVDLTTSAARYQHLQEVQGKVIDDIQSRVSTLEHTVQELQSRHPERAEAFKQRSKDINDVSKTIQQDSKKFSGVRKLPPISRKVTQKQPWRHISSSGLKKKKPL